MYPVAKNDLKGSGSSKRAHDQTQLEVFYPVAGNMVMAPGTSKLGVAERVGFEPTVELPRQQFSRLPDSAALAPLRS